jgi:hypothetical protein
VDGAHRRVNQKINEMVQVQSRGVVLLCTVFQWMELIEELTKKLMRWFRSSHVVLPCSELQRMEFIDE